jgi:hypothetical protein
LFTWPVTMRRLLVFFLREGLAMPRIPRPLTHRATLDRSFETSRFQERFLASAFEAVLPIIRRRLDQADSRCEHAPVSQSHAIQPVAQGR